METPSARERAVELIDEHDRTPGGNASLLDEVVDLLTRELERADLTQAERACVLHDLGRTFRRRFLVRQSHDDLDRSVSHHRAAVSATPQDHEHVVPHATELAYAMTARAVRTGDRAQLREAGTIAREAAEVAERAGVCVGTARTAYGHCLNQEIAAFGDPGPAAEAIKVCEAALRAPDLDQHDRTTMLMALAHLHSLGSGRKGAAKAEAFLREAAGIAEGDTLRTVQAQLAGALARRSSGSLDEAVGLARAAMAGLPPDHWISLLTALPLAAALQKRFKHRGALADLDEALAVAQTAWHALPADQPGREVFAELTRQLLWQRAQHRPDRTHFDEAIRFQRSNAPDAAVEAVGLGLRSVLAGDHAGREEAAAALRQVLAGGELDGDQAHQAQLLLAAIVAMRGAEVDVAESVAMLEPLIGGLPEDSPARARLLGMYLGALGVQASIVGDPAILDRAVTLGRAALARDGLDDDVRDGLRLVVAGNLLSRFTLRGSAEDLDAALADLREAEDRAVEADSQRANRLAMLAKAWLLGHRRTGDAEALAAAVQAAETSVKVAYDGQRATCLAQLVEVLWARYEAGGDEADARRAGVLEAQIRGASAVASISGVAPAVYQQTAAQQYLTRYQRTGDIRDVDRAVARLRSLLGSGRLPRSQHRSTAGQLAVSLRMRHERKRVPADIEESIALLRRCVAEEPAEIARAGWASALGESLRARFAATGDRPDIDTAIDHLRAALAVLDRHGLPSPLPRCALVSALLDRAELAGDPDDLHAAVDLAQAVASRQDIDVADKAAAEITLATALWSRYKYLGERADLDRSATMWQAAADALPVGDRRRILVMHNLAGVLRLRYETQGHAADLDAAIAANRAALATIPADHPDRSAIQTGLAILLQNRFVDRRDTGALGESVAQGNSGARGSRLADRAGQLHVYAQGLYLRHLEQHSGRDLRRATRLMRASVAAGDEHNPKFASRLSSLALMLQSRYERTGRRRYRVEALAALDRAAGLVTAPADARLHAARLAGRLHAHHGDVDAAAAAYRLAIQEVLPQVVWRGLGVTSHQSRLRDFPHLACDGAALAIAAGDPATALRLLEQGRTLLWAQSLDARSDRSLLRAEHPELHARLDHVISLLAGPALPEPRPGGLGTTTYRDGVAHRWQLHNEYTRLLAEIRALPDQRFAGFLGPPDLPSLRAAAKDGPIVVVNVSTHRCDALVVAPDLPAVEVVRLPALTAEDVAARAAVFAAAIRTMAPGTPLAERAGGDQDAKSTLEWLWDTVARPVLAHLRLTAPAGDAPLPRLWWCPTGQLSLLPLHAAGSADDWVGDHVVSSYTPTLRSLLHHREQAATAPPGKGALIVALSSTPPVDGVAFADLAAVPAEVAAVRERLPGDHTVLSDGAARRAHILAALADHRILHFSCHGVQDPQDPAASYLAVADGPLRVRDLARHVTRADLAFLSACETARGDTELADEALHLAAAFNFAGARHVIGTLWPIGDDIAAEIAGDVYTHLTARGPGDAVPAEALHRAITRQRDSLRGDAPLLWAAYIHHGP